VGSLWRVYAMPFEDGGRMLYIAQRGSERREARLEAAGVTAAAALAVGLLCALWLRLRVRRELLPIDALSAAVAAYDPLLPASRLAPATRTELLPLREAVHGLGSSLARRLANERAFSAHAAHALRTPLAGLVAQLAVAQRRSPPEALPTLQRARMAADRLRRVVGALLALFRSNTEVQPQPVDLAELAAHLPFETLAIHVEPGSMVQADPDLLAAALLNLLDNAVRHGASEVSVAARAGAVTIHDNGSGIAAPDRERMQAALDSQNYEQQVGLGLMLADLVARAHGGRLRLLDSDRGCAVEIGLEAARGRH
jgi:two-component system OmpR family sensor kinase